MKTLAFPFRRNGFRHELLRREGLCCLVKRSKPDHWHYEIVKLQIMPPSEFRGEQFPEREKYPSSEQWGIYGFTYLSTDTEGALKQYLSIKEAHLALGEGKDSGGTP